MKEFRDLFRIMIGLFVLFLIPFSTAAEDVFVFQGQYYEGEEFKTGNFSFTFNVYDNETGGNLVYTRDKVLETGNWGQWKVELEGISASANNASKAYFMEIVVDGVTQEPRRRLTHFNYIRKNVDETTTGDIKSFSNIEAEVVGAGSETIHVVVGDPNGISKGQPVYVSGSSNGSVEVSVSNKKDFLTLDVFGISANDGSLGQEIDIVVKGRVKGIDTSSFQAGEKVYLGEKIITNEPSGRKEGLVEIGNVIKSDATEGEILVDIISRNVVVDKAASTGFNIINRNSGSFTGATFSWFNDVLARFAIIVSSSNETGANPNAVLLFNEGKGPTINAIGSNKDFIWQSDINGTGDPPFNFIQLMRLKANGQLELLQNDLNVSRDIYSRGKLVCLEDGSNCNYTTINNSLQDLIGRFDALNASVINFDNSISNLTTNFNNLESSVNAFNNSLQTLTSNLNNLNNSFNSLNNSLQNLESDFNTLNTSVFSLNTSLESLTTNVESLNNSLTNIDNSLQDLTNNFQTLNLSFNNLNNSLQNSIQDLNNKFANLNSSVNDMENSINDLTTNYNELNSSVFNLNNSIQDLQSDISAVNLSVNALNSSLGDLDNRIGNLNTSLENLENSVDNLNNSYNELETSINTINTTVSSLNNSIGNLDDKIDNLNSSIEVLDENLDELNSSLGSINNSFIDLENRVDHVNSSLNNLSNNYSSLSNSLTSLNNSVQDLDNNFNDLNTSITSLNSSLENTDASLSSINLSVNLLNASIQSLTSKINNINLTFSSDINSLNNSLQDLKNSFDNLNLNENDTLQSITDRGSVTTNNITADTFFGNLNWSYLLNIPTILSNIITNGGVGSDELLNGSVQERHLADGAITGDKIGSVDASKIQGILNDSQVEDDLTITSTKTISTTQNVSAEFFIGDGRYLTNINNSESDTLDSVVSRGSTTNQNITVDGLNANSVTTTNDIRTSSGDVCTGTICLNSVNNTLTNINSNLDSINNSIQGISNTQQIPVSFISTVDGSFGSVTRYMALGTSAQGSLDISDASWIVGQNITITGILWNAYSNTRTSGTNLILMKSTGGKGSFSETSLSVNIQGQTSGSSLSHNISFNQGDLMAIKYDSSGLGLGLLVDPSATLIGYYE